MIPSQPIPIPSARLNFQSYLSLQSQSRLSALLLKQQLFESTHNTSQKMLVIQKHFRQKHQQLTELVKKYREKEVKYEEVIGSYNELKGYYLEINYALYAYDRQGYKEILEKILAEIGELKKKLQPRERFRFKRRDEDFGVKSTHEKVEEKEVKQSFSASIPGLSNLVSQIITVARPSASTPFKIINCTSSIIHLPFITDILFLTHLTDCTILCGPTRSTVFIDTCKNCTISINTHQLRIHNSQKCEFRVWTGSKAIIEDTKEVRFGKEVGRYVYEGKEGDLREVGREGREGEGTWKDVQDFNWLKQEQSPNFVIVEEQEEKKEKA